MLRSMVLMMMTLLQPVVQGESHAKILRIRIRLFLSALEDFKIPMRRKKPKKKKKKKKGGKRMRQRRKMQKTMKRMRIPTR